MNDRSKLSSFSLQSGADIPKYGQCSEGVLVECDRAMKQFLLYLDETSALGKKFIIQDLDDTHVFILAEVVQILQEKVGN